MQSAQAHNARLSAVDFRELEPGHLDLEIIEVNLFVYLDHQGYCDERKDLSRSKLRQRLTSEPEPPSANHYAIWFVLGESVMVSIDITQLDYEHLPNPYKTEGPINEASLARVRVASKLMPAPDDAACVMREVNNIKPGTTIRTILELICSKGLHLYRFRPTFKQHSGCRYWILAFSYELEKERIVGRGFAEDVESFLTIHYHRLTEMVRGKFKKGGKWGQSTGLVCADIIAGEFLEPAPASDPESREQAPFRGH